MLERQMSATTRLVRGWAGVLLWGLLPCVSLLGSAAAQDAGPVGDDKRPPNIVYILADDLGYGDVGAYGGAKVPTPHLDRLAARGVRFTQHYSGSTVCAPSRASLMTGLHTGHVAVRGNNEHKPEGQAPMPEGTRTVGHLLQGAGYTTGAFGKWGLGYPGSVSDPLKMGFDWFYGYNCQREAHSYYPGHLWDNDQRVLLKGNAGGARKDYAPHQIHREALSFIHENKNRPFFLYYALVQPHAEMDAPEPYLERFRGRYGQETPHTKGKKGGYRATDEPKAAFAAMVTVLDDYVGAVLDALEEQGLAENTLVIFTSDNGPHGEGGHQPRFFDSSGPLRGMKRDLYEGGVRVPMIAAWPGRIAPGTTTDHVSAFWDVLPTAAAVAGVDAPAGTDGVSMLPTLLGEPGQVEHDYLYWEFPRRGGRVALRRGDWKLVRYNVNKKKPGLPELYHLATDLSETRNVAADHPERVAEMTELMRAARTRPVDPKFYFEGLGDREPTGR